MTIVKDVYVFWTIFFYLSFVEVSADSEETDYAWDVNNYPNLTSPLSAKFCTGPDRNPPSSVCDVDQVLSKTQALRLDDLIDHQDNETKCVCDYCHPHKRGFRIKVAIVKRLKIPYNLTELEAVKRFTEITRRQWRFGECDNDVLIFLSTKIGIAYTSMGYTALKIVTEDTVTQISEACKNYFLNGNYYVGLETIIASYQDVLYNYKPSNSASKTIIMIASVTVGVLLVLTVFLAAIWCFMQRENQHSVRGSFEFVGMRAKKGKQTQAKSRPTEEYTPVAIKESLCDD